MKKKVSKYRLFEYLKSKDDLDICRPYLIERILEIPTRNFLVYFGGTLIGWNFSCTKKAGILKSMWWAFPFSKCLL